jgi:ketosteroid isomerase-like protein
VSVDTDSAAIVLSGFLDAMGSLDPDRAIAYFADEGTFAFPYAPPGMPALASGRKEVMALLRGMPMFETIELYDRDVHTTDDPELAFATFGSRARLRGAGPYANRYVSLARVREGRIVEYQEHFGPLALIAALPLRRRLPMLVLAALPPKAAGWALNKRLRRGR